MPYSKCFNDQTLIVCYGNFTKNQNPDGLFRHRLVTIGFSKWKKKKKENPGFCGYFFILISNIFVEKLATHKTIYIS